MSKYQDLVDGGQQALIAPEEAIKSEQKMADQFKPQPARMIPPAGGTGRKKSEKRQPPPSDPTHDLARAAQAPDEVLSVYRPQFKRPVCCGALFAAGSLTFSILLPYLVGWFISIQGKTDQPSDNDGPDDFTQICYWVSISAAVSILCEWVQQTIFKVASHSVAKQLRYDMYLAYFKKVRAANLLPNQKVDEVKSRKALDFKSVEENISVLQVHISTFMPSRLKSVLMVLACLGCQFWISWQLTLVNIGSLAALGITFVVGEICLLKRAAASQKIEESIADVVRKSFKAAPSDFNSWANKLDQLNEDCYTSKKRASCCFGIKRAFNVAFIFVYQCGLIYFCKTLYDEDQLRPASPNNSFSTAALPLDRLVMFLLYFALMARNASQMAPSSTRAHKQELLRAQNELFAKIKMSPVMEETKDEKNARIQADSMKFGEGSIHKYEQLLIANGGEDSAGDQLPTEENQDAFLSLVEMENQKSMITSRQQGNQFLGSKILVFANSRTQLPHLGEYTSIPVWKVIKNFIGQDLTRVSLPVILNEPVCALQKFCSFLTADEYLYRQAAVSEDPVRRMVLAQIAQITPFVQIKCRKKKPFNPMLGETFEMVTEHYRFYGEKVQHTPKQIMAFCLEGENYELLCYNSPKPQFKFNGGKGELNMNIEGCRDIYFKKFDEHVSFTHPTFAIRNLIWGGNFPDVAGRIEALNNKTGERMHIDVESRANATDYSTLSGKAFDAQGNLAIEVSGSWQDEIKITTLATGITETVWKEKPLIPNAHLQYFFDEQSILLNYKSEEMVGIVAPTDTRFRGDLRYFEEGEKDEAELEKNDIEQQQRRVRKRVESGEIPAWQPRFFTERVHPFIDRSKLAIYGADQCIKFEPMKGNGSSYWERREAGDWADLPELWGPFEEE